MARKKLKKPRILIVEDSETQRILFERWFKKAGCSVSTARNSQEAEINLEQGADIVLVDFNLGSERGLDLAKKIKDRHPEILAHLMTARPKNTFCFRSSFGEIQCIEKTSEEKLFVPVIMRLWEIKQTEEELKKVKNLQQLLPFKNQITGISRNTKNPKRETTIGRLDDPEGRDTRWVVYDGYLGHGNTIDICLAVLYGCFGECLHCFSGLFRTNARQLTMLEIISQFLHSLDSIHAINWIKRKISVSFSNEGDFIYNWRRVFQVIILLWRIKELDISFVISTIGNARVFREFIKAYKEFLPGRLPIRIYWSLHTLIPILREWFLKGTKGQSIKETIEVLIEYAKISGQKVTIQWLVIIGFNDAPKDIDMIVDTFAGSWDYFDFKVMPFAEKGKKNYMAPYGFTIPATMDDAHAFAYELNKRGVPARAREDCGIYGEDDETRESMGNTVPDFDGFRPTS